MMIRGEQASDRSVLEVSGDDRLDFLKGLITRDPVPSGLVYSAMLTPQGKFLFDFFALQQDDSVLLDVAADRAQALAQRLGLYKLRAKVTIAPTDLVVLRGLGDPPSGAHPDPRDPDLGWRACVPPEHAEIAEAEVDWTARRVARAIPEAGPDLTPEDSFILEWGFERMGGVDHRKGCYVGQEVTARMKHKTELRKGLEVVAIDGDAPVGTPVEVDGKVVGKLHSQGGGRALVHLRYDRAQPVMRAGEATLTRLTADQT